MNKKSLLSASLSLFLSSTLLLTFCSTAPAHAEQSWNVQTIDVNGAGMGNGYCPIILDWGGTPLIAYTGYDPPYQYGIVKYARWNGSGWSIQEVDSFAHAFDLMLDANGNPHILYGLADLKYASWTGFEWTSQTVDETGSNYVYGSLALDSFGNPHAAYSDGEALKYASRNGSTWTIQTVDTYSEIPFQLSLVIDSNDTPYILYSNPTTYEDKSTGIDYDSRNVKLAVLENSVWNIQTVPLPPPIGGYSNIVLDSKGYPHFIFTRKHFANPPGDMNLLSDILYASWDGAAWKTQTVVSNVDLESIGSLALDSYDYPHISYITTIYIDGWPQTLMCAGWTGAAWNIQTVDSNARGGPCYLAVDSNRIPHISYRSGGINDRTKRIMYATATEPVPLYSPLPLQLVLAAVVIGAAVFIAYLWKKKT